MISQSEEQRMEAHSQTYCSQPYFQEPTALGRERAHLAEFKAIVQSLSPWQRRLLLISLYYLLALGNLRRFLRI
jgi:hypothetical protein